MAPPPSSAPPPAVRRSNSTSSTGTPWREVYFAQARHAEEHGLHRHGARLRQVRPRERHAGDDRSASRTPRRQPTRSPRSPSGGASTSRRSDLPNLAAIVAEPFRLASSRVDNERQSWRHDVERKYLQYFGLKKLCVVDSASLCLFANSLTSGVVVNIGFGVTFVVPVLGGHVKRDAVKVWPVGGMTLTQWYGELLDQAGVDAQWSPEMGAPQIPPVTVARNLKEASIEAAPTPLRETFGSSPYNLGRVLARDDAPSESGYLFVRRSRIGWERFVVRAHSAQFSSPPRQFRFTPRAIPPVHSVRRRRDPLRSDGGARSARFGIGRASGDSCSPRSTMWWRPRVGRRLRSGGSHAGRARACVVLPEARRAMVAADADGSRPEAHAQKESGMISMQVKVAPPQQGDLTTWFGASMLAGTSTLRRGMTGASTRRLSAPPAQGTRASQSDASSRRRRVMLGTTRLRGRLPRTTMRRMRTTTTTMTRTGEERQSRGRRRTTSDEAFLEAEEAKAHHESQEGEGRGGGAVSVPAGLLWRS